MFIVKLGTGTEFSVDSVQHDVSGVDGDTPLTNTCTMEKTPSDHSVTWYAEKLSEPGALKNVEVKSESGDTLIPAEDWQSIRNISMRLITTGQMSVSVVLVKGL